MGSFGENLKREREMRGVSLQEISEATKIGTRALRSLEEERFDQLPGGIFNKGFVRAYARFLGMDEEAAVVAYEQAAGVQSEPQPYHRQVNEHPDPESYKPSVGLLLVRIAGVLILVVAASYIGWKQYQSWSEQSAAEAAARQKVEFKPAPPPQAAPQTPAANPAPTPAVDPNADEASKGSDPVNLSIVAKQRTWVSVTTDAGAPKTTMLDPDDEASSKLVVHAQKRVVLVVGNAGGVEVGFNGKKQGALGEEGRRKQVIYLPDGPATATPAAKPADKPARPAAKAAEE